MRPLSKGLLANVLAITLGTLPASAAAPDTPFRNLSELRSHLGFKKLETQSSRKIRVAVLDKGFKGYQKQIGRSLPKNTVYIPGPLQAPEESNTEHGLRMAQILAGLYSNNPARAEGLELYLYNVFGFTNFQAAVADLIRRNVDVVLYSEVWEFGGNLDGRGFINAEVSKATRKNILWINAVGNFAYGTYNGPIKTTDEDRVILPNENYLLKIECRAGQGNTCPVRVVLSWNDFKDDSKKGTDKDLDLELVNSLFDRIAISELRQTKKPLGDDAPPGASNYPREIIIAQIKHGFSYVKVKNYSKNFDSKDRLRITVDGENVLIPSGDRYENILVPADHPEVISVGAFDSDRSGVSKRLTKPEVFAPSSIVLNDGNEFRGSSNAAAMTAAAAALLRRAEPGLTREDFLRNLRKFNWDEGGLPLPWLRFGAADRTCFQEGQWAQAPSHVRAILNQGGKLVETTHGWRIMVPFDPFLLNPVGTSYYQDDMVAVSTDGLKVYPRNQALPQGAAEVFQRPREIGLCHPPLVTNGRILGF